MNYAYVLVSYAISAASLLLNLTMIAVVVIGLLKKRSRDDAEIGVLIGIRQALEALRDGQGTGVAAKR